MSLKSVLAGAVLLLIAHALYTANDPVAGIFFAVAAAQMVFVRGSKASGREAVEGDIYG